LTSDKKKAVQQLIRVMENAHPEMMMPAGSSGRTNPTHCDSCFGTLDDVEWLLEKRITHREDSGKNRNIHRKVPEHLC
jgi:hypothetical protein